MSDANSQNNDCHEGVCKAEFKPSRIARKSFQNLKSLAGDLIDKVKETLTGDNYDAVPGDDSEQAGQRAHLAKMQTTTVKDNQVNANIHVSMHKADIIDRFAQYSYDACPNDEEVPLHQKVEALKLVHVRARAPESQLKPSRYSNPWRYDNRH